MGRLVMSISAGITAFVLAITAGAIYTYRSTSSSPAQPTQAVESAPPPKRAEDMVAVEAPPVTADVSPQDAASIAAKFLNRTDLYSVELADQQGVQTYKVTFASGDVVYVGLKGDVLSAVPPPPPAILTITTGGGGGHRGGDGGGGGGGGAQPSGEGEHEAGDD